MNNNIIIIIITSYEHNNKDLMATLTMHVSKYKVYKLY